MCIPSWSIHDPRSTHDRLAIHDRLLICDRRSTIDRRLVPVAKANAKKRRTRFVLRDRQRIRSTGCELILAGLHLGRSASWAVCILGGLRGTNWRRSEEKPSEVSHTVHNDLPTEGECEQAPNKIRSPSQAAYSIDELRAHLGRSASWAVCILGGLRGTNWRRSEEKLSEVSHTVHNDLPTEGECEQAPNKIRSPSQAAYSIDELRAHLGRSASWAKANANKRRTRFVLRAKQRIRSTSCELILGGLHLGRSARDELEKERGETKANAKKRRTRFVLRARQRIRSTSCELILGGLHLGRSASWAVCILGGLRGTNWRRSEEKPSEVSHTVHNDLPTEGECEQAPNKIRSPSQAAYSIDELRAHLGRSASWAVCILGGLRGTNWRRSEEKLSEVSHTVHNDLPTEGECEQAPNKIRSPRQAAYSIDELRAHLGRSASWAKANANKRRTRFVLRDRQRIRSTSCELILGGLHLGRSARDELEKERGETKANANKRRTRFVLRAKQRIRSTSCELILGGLHLGRSARDELEKERGETKANAKKRRTRFVLRARQRIRSTSCELILGGLHLGRSASWAVCILGGLRGTNWRRSEEKPSEVSHTVHNDLPTEGECEQAPNKIRSPSQAAYSIDELRAHLGRSASWAVCILGGLRGTNWRRSEEKLSEVSHTVHNDLPTEGECEQAPNKIRSPSQAAYSIDELRAHLGRSASWAKANANKRRTRFVLRARQRIRSTSCELILGGLHLGRSARDELEKERGETKANANKRRTRFVLRAKQRIRSTSCELILGGLHLGRSARDELEKERGETKANAKKRRTRFVLRARQRIRSTSCELILGGLHLGRSASWAVCILGGLRGTNWRRSEEKPSEVSHTVHNDLPTEGECEQAPNKIRSPSQAAYSIDELRAHLGRSASWAVCILGGLRGTNWRRSEEKLSEVSHTVHNDLPTEGECEQAPNKIRSPRQAAYSIDELRAHLGRSASWAVCAGRIGEGARRNCPK
ncbi:hypothetical protein PHYSODRAFT_328657 [Phytophthora sojae]|uniref:Uncharacterized protein n=1 Tax=Phytophthora sojae (strain P6497) TaxID=1094619 RepID=G4ZA05_PHYSP|nr:hypothetical protein PHYSODRAFT_328657 [Phytophthora sojae]EGZ20554.1 hypothetical protein PHYSODRAFT_328657 [Phytophthora sojae]|eukprot:XP_009523271.1 hypothetical protein PHYSODRAFT_328657 [Phytophthora sojae]